MVYLGFMIPIYSIHITIKKTVIQGSATAWPSSVLGVSLISASQSGQTAMLDWALVFMRWLLGLSKTEEASRLFLDLVEEHSGWPKAKDNLLKY